MVTIEVDSINMNDANLAFVKSDTMVLLMIIFPEKLLTVISGRYVYYYR